MASILNYVTEGPRIFLKSWINRVHKKEYEGNAEEICKEIVKECWNGRFFQTSTDNFPQFWTRDFGWCVYSLLELGYKNEIHHTLRYAMNRFKQKGKVTTTLSPGGKPFNFPKESVDSLPWLIHAIKLSGFGYHSFKPFLNKEILRYFSTFINKETGLVKPEEHFSSMKDFSVRRSSCYDNCMVAMLAIDLKRMKLDNPFSKYDYSELIVRHFWNGEYFYDDLRKEDYVAGDANLFPFLSGAVKDENKLKSVVEKVSEAGLDMPLPLKYTSSRKGVKFIWQEIFLRDYESDAIWTHMGPLWIKLVGEVDAVKAEKYKQLYTDMIEKHKNYMEVFDTNGKVFSTPFYYCSPGMLWAANYLTL